MAKQKLADTVRNGAAKAAEKFLPGEYGESMARALRYAPDAAEDFVIWGLHIPGTAWIEGLWNAFTEWFNDLYFSIASSSTWKAREKMIGYIEDSPLIKNISARFKLPDEYTHEVQTYCVQSIAGFIKKEDMEKHADPAAAIELAKKMHDDLAGAYRAYLTKTHGNAYTPDQREAIAQAAAAAITGLTPEMLNQPDAEAMLYYIAKNHPETLHGFLGMLLDVQRNVGVAKPNPKYEVPPMEADPAMQVALDNVLNLPPAAAPPPPAATQPPPPKTPPKPVAASAAAAPPPPPPASEPVATAARDAAPKDTQVAGGAPANQNSPQAPKPVQMASGSQLIGFSWI